MARIEIGELEAFLKWLETVEFTQAGTGFLTENPALLIPDGVVGYVDGSDHLTLESGAVGNTIFVQRESGTTPTEIVSVEGLYGGAIYTLVNNDPDDTDFTIVAGADIESRMGDVGLFAGQSILIRAITPTSFEVLPGPLSDLGSQRVLFTTEDGEIVTSSSFRYLNGGLPVLVLTGGMSCEDFTASGTSVTLSGLPTSAPGTSGRLWNDGGTVKIS